MNRSIDTVVISDVHLGANECQAEDLIQYLNSINPKRIILNGDFIDVWQTKYAHWPESHINVINVLLNMLSNGVEIFYITGNYDEKLRNISDLQLGLLHVRDNLVLEMNGEKVWFIHGDILNRIHQFPNWFIKRGKRQFDFLMHINRWMNYFSEMLGKSRISLSSEIKDGACSAIDMINDFELATMELAIENGYDYVVCGHIHQPKIRGYENDKGTVIYMNSGDWVSNLTALEFDGYEWTIMSLKNRLLKRLAS